MCGMVGHAARHTLPALHLVPLLLIDVLEDHLFGILPVGTTEIGLALGHRERIRAADEHALPAAGLGAHFQRTMADVGRRSGDAKAPTIGLAVFRRPARIVLQTVP